MSALCNRRGKFGILVLVWYGFLLQGVFPVYLMASDQQVGSAEVLVALACSTSYVDCSKGPGDLGFVLHTALSIDTQNVCSDALKTVVRALRGSVLVVHRAVLKKALWEARAVLEGQHEGIASDELVRTACAVLDAYEQALVAGELDTPMGSSRTGVNFQIMRNTGATWVLQTQVGKGYFEFKPSLVDNKTYTVFDGGVAGAGLGTGTRFYENVAGTATQKAYLVTDTSTGNIWEMLSHAGSTTMTFQPNAGEINTNKSLTLGAVTGTTTAQVNVATGSSTGVKTVNIATGSGAATGPNLVTIGSADMPTTLTLGQVTAWGPGDKIDLSAYTVIYKPSGTRFLHTGNLAAGVSGPAAGNTFLGEDAGRLDCPFDGESGALYDTGVGYHALGAAALNTSYCTAVGANALAATESGWRNVGVGYNALSSNVDGGSNTALGADALELSVSAYDEVAVGAFALGTLTEGDSNVAGGGVLLSCWLPVPAILP
jgi:hypothetical protein